MSSFGSSFFGKKNAKRPALLKMKGEHNKPLACGARRRGRRRCRFGVRGLCGRRGLLLRPADADVRGVRVVAARGGDAEERGSYASTDERRGPARDRGGEGGERVAGLLAEGRRTRREPDASLPGKAPNRSSNRKKPVRSKVPPPCTAMALVRARRRRRLGRRGRRGAAHVVVRAAEAARVLPRAPKGRRRLRRQPPARSGATRFRNARPFPNDRPKDKGL